MKKRQRAQTLLETVVIFIALASLLVGVMSIFKNNTLDIFGRIDTFRRSRLPAVNSLVQGIGRGMKPLDYALMGSQTGGFLQSPGIPGFGDTAQEPRALTAQLRLLEMDTLLNFIIPYKANQVRQISYDSYAGLTPAVNPYDGDSNPKLKKKRDCNFWSCGDWYWTPAKYINEIKSLCTEMSSYGVLALTKIRQALTLLRDVFDNPVRFGPYYPIQCQDSSDAACSCRSPNPKTCPADNRLPTYTQTCGSVENAECRAKFTEQYISTFEMIRASVEQNRAMLSQTISSLDQAQQPGQGLDYMLNTAPVTKDISDYSGGIEIKGFLGRVEYIKNNIGIVDHCHPSGFIACYQQHKSHWVSEQLAQELIDFSGSVIPCMFGKSFANQITSVRSLLAVQSKTNVTQALNIVTNWQDVLVASNIGGNLGSVDLSTAISDLNDQGYNLDENKDFELTGLNYAQNLCSEIINNLTLALDNWDDQMNRSFSISSAYVNVDALYKVTSINRRGNYTIN